jgi:hypothetical protein
VNRQEVDMPKQLDPSEAVRHAKRWLASVYVDEKIENVGLEEVRWKDGNWEITLGFDRFPQETSNRLETWAFLSKPRRQYKVIVLSGEDNIVIEMSERDKRPLADRLADLAQKLKAEAGPNPGEVTKEDIDAMWGQ